MDPAEKDNNSGGWECAVEDVAQRRRRSIDCSREAWFAVHHHLCASMRTCHGSDIRLGECVWCDDVYDFCHVGLFRLFRPDANGVDIGI